jgi:serine/threonine protein kinase
MKHNNPNLVNVFDVIESANQIYIFMELCNGGDLECLLSEKKYKGQQVTVEETVSVIR